MQTTNHKDIELIDTNQAAIFLNMKVSRLRNLVFIKQIPFFKIGASVRFNKSDLIAWLANKKQGVQNEG